MGLTDFFSILTFALFLIIFFLIMRLSIGNILFEIPKESRNIEYSISALGILRTPVMVDNTEMNIGELIALSNLDASKKPLVENTIKQLLDKSFGTSSCAIICINRQELKGSGCGSLQSYTCYENVIKIPAYDGSLIEVSLQYNIEPTDFQLAP